MGRWSLILAETKASAVFSDCGGFFRAGVRLGLVDVRVFVVFVLVALMGVVDVARPRRRGARGCRTRGRRGAV